MSFYPCAIKVSRVTKARLDELRIVPEEHYDTIINGLLAEHKAYQIPARKLRGLGTYNEDGTPSREDF